MHLGHECQHSTASRCNTTKGRLSDKSIQYDLCSVSYDKYLGPLIRIALIAGLLVFSGFLIPTEIQARCMLEATSNLLTFSTLIQGCY